MYSLDVETLLGVLQGLKVRGSIEAILLSSIIEIPAKSRVVLELNEGKMLSATIYAPQGYVLFQGKEALERIRQKVLTWQLTETLSANTENAFSVQMPEQPPYAPMQPKQPTQPMRPVQSVQSAQPIQQPAMDQRTRSSASLDTFIPVRLPTRLSSQQQWSRTRMRIYALVNGRNSIAYIAHLLSLPGETVYIELKALQAEHMIDIR